MNKDQFKDHGMIWPMGIPVSQSWHEIGAILSIVHEYKIFRFVELGIEHGGLGVLLSLRPYISKAFKYLGIEISKEKVQPNLFDRIKRMKNSTIRIDDCLSAASSFVVWEFIQDEKALVFCDNGNKPKEFQIYSGIIKPGDLLLVHDYPREFNEENSDFNLLDRIELDYLKDTRLVLFQRKKNE